MYETICMKKICHLYTHSLLSLLQTGTSISDCICKNMPGDYSNNVPLARRDLTTPPG